MNMCMHVLVMYTLWQVLDGTSFSAFSEMTQPHPLRYTNLEQRMLFSKATFHYRQHGTDKGLIYMYSTVHLKTLSWWGQTSQRSLDSSCFELISSHQQEIRITCLMYVLVQQVMSGIVPGLSVFVPGLSAFVPGYPRQADIHGPQRYTLVPV